MRSHAFRPRVAVYLLALTTSLGARETLNLVPAGLDQADVSITKTDGVGTATPGGGTTYTITASNAGPSTTAATVADTFPAELTCNWTCAEAGGGSCTAAGSDDINDSVSLPSGGSVTYTAICTIASSATGTLSNTATVTAVASDPDTDNNSATDADTLTPSADVRSSQSDSDPVAAHANLIYSISAHNDGPSDADAVTLVDTMPEGAVFVSSTPGSPICAESAGVLTCDLGSVPAGTDTSVTVTVEPVTIGTLQNHVMAHSSTSDPDSTNQSSIESTIVRFVKGDASADLATDLFLTQLSTNVNAVWLMNGVVRTSAPAVSPATAAAATQQVAGVDDFDGDYRNDLVFWNSATGDVEFWLMNGTDRIGSPVPIAGAPTLATNWRLSATADFNQDGKADIVWRNTTSQKIVLWTMNGTTKSGDITPVPDQAVDANWEIVAALDLNADGFPDFLWYNPSSGKIVYWRMNAAVQRVTGGFTIPANAGDSNWKVLAAGDFGVGPGGLPNTADIVWRNADSGRLVVWYMDTSSVRTSGTFTTPDAPDTPATDWTIVGPR